MNTNGIVRKGFRGAFASVFLVKLFASSVKDVTVRMTKSPEKALTPLELIDREFDEGEDYVSEKISENTYHVMTEDKTYVAKFNLDNEDEPVLESLEENAVKQTV